LLPTVYIYIKLLHRLHFPKTSAWAQWVQGRASVANLKGDLYGDHWSTLRQILPLYQAITTVQIGDGTFCSFWHDVWFQDESLEDLCPTLYSHCIEKDCTVAEMFSIGLPNSLVPRLTARATSELHFVQQLLGGVNLDDSADKRLSVFSKGEAGLDTGALYRLLKSRGQRNDFGASFVWKNSAPPRVQLFMWLLVQERIQSRSLLRKKHIVQDSTCQVCNASEETPEHIIGGCAIAISFWARLNLNSMIRIQLQDLQSVTPPPGLPVEDFPAFLALACWEIWKGRNAKVFRQESI